MKMLKAAGFHWLQEALCCFGYLLPTTYFLVEFLFSYFYVVIVFGALKQINVVGRSSIAAEQCRSENGECMPNDAAADSLHVYMNLKQLYVTMKYLH